MYKATLDVAFELLQPSNKQTAATGTTLIASSFTLSDKKNKDERVRDVVIIHRKRPFQSPSKGNASQPSP